MQARQLLTDPAVAREFERLRGVAEVKAQEVRKLQEELQAVNFSQESKAGRLLMAKCRALQVPCLPSAAIEHQNASSAGSTHAVSIGHVRACCTRTGKVKFRGTACDASANKSCVTAYSSPG